MNVTFPTTSVVAITILQIAAAAQSLPAITAVSAFAGKTASATIQLAPDGSQRVLLERLARAEATWAINRTDSYEFTFELACNGLMPLPPPGYAPMVFRVRGGAVETPPQVLSRMPAWLESTEFAATVEGHFRFIRKSLEMHPYRLDVEYDSIDGHPTRVCVDPSFGTDDEYGFVITGLKGLPPGERSSPFSAHASARPGDRHFIDYFTVDPPQLEPDPAVQPKQWRPTTIGRRSSASIRKSRMWRGTPSARLRSSI